MSLSELDALWMKTYETVKLVKDAELDEESVALLQSDRICKGFLKLVGGQFGVHRLKDIVPKTVNLSAGISKVWGAIHHVFLDLMSKTGDCRRFHICQSLESTPRR